MFLKHYQSSRIDFSKLSLYLPPLSHYGIKTNCHAFVI